MANLFIISVIIPRELSFYPYTSIFIAKKVESRKKTYRRSVLLMPIDVLAPFELWICLLLWSTHSKNKHNYSILVSHRKEVTTTRSHFFENRSYLFHVLLHWHKFTARKTLLLSSPVFCCACSSLLSDVTSSSVFSSAGSSALVLFSAAVDWGELDVGLWSRTQHPCWQHKHTSTFLLWVRFSLRSSRSIGSLHGPVTWYRINYAGTQIKQWAFLLAVQPDLPLFWKSHCVICVPA